MTAGTITSLTRNAQGPNHESNFSVPTKDKNYIRPRTNTDQWDKHFAVRDLRLTGNFRGTSASPEAHESFETNSVVFSSNTAKPWILRKHIIMKNSPSKWARKYQPDRDIQWQEVKEDYIKSMGK
ncbi:unnamed protein product [[Candida] boidinii]|uniref:Unnamed protein product n=1 Tax=Candida boidinii TaxID=5477 RepID=A0A9W6SVE9_CANBO|nr:hypothetical protein BVG19_g2762 [[Candida] boidinii]OWB49200.1 hypothetical protein B5S27_g740 [[Candida] boidinii]OWB68218.1 hypothetical protein B5S30_g3593 [[Candida] boidinii]OWB81602.1 hypothetical protein B5S33_g221 [[Candida] boidinii]GME67169.1 unnamed protein product [[Candida] boidinii]